MELEQGNHGIVYSTILTFSKQPPIKWVPGDCSPGHKVPGFRTCRSLSCKVGVKIASPPQPSDLIRFRVTQHRDAFMFLPIHDVTSAGNARDYTRELIWIDYKILRYIQKHWLRLHIFKISLTGNITYWKYNLLEISLTRNITYWKYQLLEISLTGNINYWKYHLLEIRVRYVHGVKEFTLFVCFWRDRPPPPQWTGF